MLPWPALSPDLKPHPTSLGWTITVTQLSVCILLTIQCFSFWIPSLGTTICWSSHLSGGLIHSHQRYAAGSQPAGWAAAGSTAGRWDDSVGTGRRCPAAAPATGCCRTSLRSQTLYCLLVVGCQYCSQVKTPSASEELIRGEEGEEIINVSSDRRFHVQMIYQILFNDDLVTTDLQQCPVWHQVHLFVPHNKLNLT